MPTAERPDQLGKLPDGAQAGPLPCVAARRARGRCLGFASGA